MSDLSEQKLKVKLSWRKYWEKFKEEHGDPIEYNGYCLFEDGWRYALSDPAGPEYPPPENEKECLSLRIKYYELRLKMVESEYRMLLSDIKNLELLQQRFSLPLQQRTHYSERIEGETKIRTEYFELDLQQIKEGRLKWLEEDIEECKSNLEVLKDARKNLFKVLNGSVSS